MPGKSKTNKRLDKLFKGVSPEETVSAGKSKPPVKQDAAPPPAAPKPAQSAGAASTPKPAPVPQKRHTSALVLPDVAPPTPVSESTSVYSTNIQVGDMDWATLRLVDENIQRVWSPDEQLLIKQVTDQLSLALENARLFQETQKRAQELTAVNEVVTAASSTLTLSDILQTIADKLLEILNAARVGIALMNDSKTELVLAADAASIYGQTSFIGNAIRVEGNPATQQVLQTRKPLFIQDVPNNPLVTEIRDLLLERGTYNLLIVPLVAENEVIGTIGCDFNEPNRVITQDELRIIETIVIQTATAIQKSRLFERTERSENELRSLFAAMDDVVLVIDKDGRYLQIAPTNPSLLVRPPVEMIGKTFHELLPKETADLFLEKVQQALTSEEKVQFEYELPVIDSIFWFLANLTRLDQDKVFWVAKDITERKNAEEAIRRRNEYLAVSAEIGKLVTSTLDPNTIFVRTVNLINERFGFYHAGIFVVEETGFHAVLREATGEAGKEMKARAHSLEVGGDSIVGRVTADGAPVVVNDTTTSGQHRFNPLLPETRAEAAIPLRIGSRIIGVIDIQAKTPNAFLEDEISILQTLADQVAVAIDNARSYELSQEAVREMREIDRLKSQFLANMSHELRTPLNSIIGFSRVILKGIDGPVTELQQQDLTAIYNSGQHLLGLINDILDLAKIEAGKMELAFDEVNITDVTNSVLSTMAGLVKDKPIQMKSHIEPNLPTVRADAIRVRQVMINLLSNAAKFTDEGDINVEVSCTRAAWGTKRSKSASPIQDPVFLSRIKRNFSKPFHKWTTRQPARPAAPGWGCPSVSN
jgi:PAS domain S-box-containing protein